MARSLYNLEWRGDRVGRMAMDAAVDALVKIAGRVEGAARVVVREHALSRPGGYHRRPGAMGAEENLHSGGLRTRPGLPGGVYVRAEFPAFQVEHGTRRSKGIEYIKRGRRRGVRNWRQVLNQAVGRAGIRD